MIPSVRPSYNKNHLKKSFSKFLKGELGTETIKEFEMSFAKAINSKHAISFPYGRAGLFAFLKSQKITMSNIILPAYQCLVVPNAILESENTPVFIDNVKNSVNMDISRIKESITEETKAVIATHMHGYSTDIDQIKDNLKDNMFLIEDSCLAIFSKFGKKQTGNIGDISFYSFNNTKQLTADDGGMVVTNNEDIAKKLFEIRETTFKKPTKFQSLKRFFKTFSNNEVYENEKLFNSIYYLWSNFDIVKKITKPVDINDMSQPSDFTLGFDPIRAYIGLLQLGELPEKIKRRKEIGRRYYETLEKISNIDFQPYDEGSTYGHFPVWSKHRDTIKIELKKCGIATGHSFDYSCPYTPASKRVYGGNTFPESKKISEEIFNLPMHGELTDSEVEFISERLEKICKHL